MLQYFIPLISFVALGLGVAIGYILRKQLAQGQVNSLEAKAQRILTEAKAKEQELLLKAKEKAIKVIDDAKREEEGIRKELRAIQERLEKREGMFDQKLLEFDEKQVRLGAREKEVEDIKAAILKTREDAIATLQKLSGLSTEEAKTELLQQVETHMQDDLLVRLRKLQKENSDHFENEAKKILSTVVARYAASHSTETTTTRVPLPSDEMKGRIIGKEGRNIKALEQITGCEFIIDETPEMITISGFSPIRRQIARIALEKLIQDGRIQPARIEEFVELAKRELALDIKRAGEEALYEMGITGIDPKLVGIVGRLKYRTSYGQNVLTHSLEVGHLAGMIASELGEDQALAKRGGFFHDIGKAIDHETQGAHPQLGYALLKKFNFPEEVAYCCIAHHEDNPTTLVGTICKAADAISGARPGARRDSYEQYIARLEDLEKAATSFPGIEKAYAIQAGREVRVFVRPEEVDDFKAVTVARDIARKIESEMQYPGEVRVTLIREKRVIEYAR